jgi:hypothetical protein
MTSSVDRPELVKVLVIRQTLDFAFREPQDWDQRPLAAQGLFLVAVLRDALRQVLDLGSTLSAGGPGEWFLWRDETRSGNDSGCEAVKVAGGFMSVSAETDRGDRWPNEPNFVVTKFDTGRQGRDAPRPGFPE